MTIQRFFSLAGKRALVTGAAQGLGRGIALALAGAGADVIINDLPDNHRAMQTVADIQSLGVFGEYIAADITSEHDVARMFEEVSANSRGLDILVNNAGTTIAKDIFQTTPDEWRKVMDINLTGIFLCCKKAMVLMRECGFGRIVNISSVVGQRGALHGHVHYAASKSGIIGFSKTLARTAAPLGITVNCIAPGIIETELLVNTHGRAEVERLADTVPLGLGTSDDIGAAAVFLAGEAGRYITGATIDVNGGMYLR